MKVVEKKSNIKTWNEIAYDLGVKDGKKGSVNIDNIRSRKNSLDVIHEIYQRGYKWGAEHRNSKMKPKYHSGIIPD